MHPSGVHLDNFAYSAAMNADVKAQHWQKALGLFFTMQQASVQPDVISYSAGMSACEKGREWAHANPLALHALMAQTNGNGYGYGHCLQ